MNRRTQALIGATVLLLGVGVVALGYFEEETTVRYVEDLHADPDGHSAGTYTLLGIPQPPELHTAGADGTERVEANPAYANRTVDTVLWSHDGTDYLSTHTLTVDGPDADGTTHWTLRNETRRAGHADLAFPPTEESWAVTGLHTVFRIQAFQADGASEPAVVWGVYKGPLRDPVQPKPSQFEGRLAADLPDGALVFDVEELTVGCSSKFLPPEVAEEYDQDGDGRTD